MSNSIDSIKDDLRNLCIEYIQALKELEENKLISKELCEECSKNKVLFLQE